MNTMQKLLSGYHQFYRHNFVHNPHLSQRVSQDQTPKTLIIACSDSRVSPLSITNSNFGETFVIRNVANLVPPYQPNPDSLHGVSAALEFGVCHLHVENIIVMGHSNCGGIHAACEGVAAPDGQDFSFISPWVEIAKNASNEPTKTECEQQAIKISLHNLMSFPWIAERVEKGELELHGWYFRIEDGKLLSLQDGQFSDVPATT